MAQINFFATRERKILYYTIEIYHPAIGSLRYVRNQDLDKYFRLESTADRNAGQLVEFTAAAFTEDRPSLSDDGVLEMTIQLGRVGLDVKKKLKAIEKYNLDTPNITPTDFVYRTFLSGDNGPNGVIPMWVKSITLQGDGVVIACSDDNPNSINVSRKYNAQDFPGLRVLS